MSTTCLAREALSPRIRYSAPDIRHVLKNSSLSKALTLQTLSVDAKHSICEIWGPCQASGVGGAG